MCRPLLPTLQRGHASPRGSRASPSWLWRAARHAFNGATRHRVDRVAADPPTILALLDPSTGPRVTAWIEAMAANVMEMTCVVLQRGHASPRGSRRQTKEQVMSELRPSTGPRVPAWIELILVCPVARHVRPSTGPRVTAWIECEGGGRVKFTTTPFNGATRHRVDRAEDVQELVNESSFLQRGHASPRGSSADLLGLFEPELGPSTGPRVTAWIETRTTCSMS